MSTFAPGRPIAARSRNQIKKAGLACLFEVNGAPHAVTCGHTFGRLEAAISLRNSATVLATIAPDDNFFHDANDPFDAAVARLTEAGIRAVEAAIEDDPAAPWCRSVEAPAPGHQGRAVTFHPTSSAGLDPVVSSVRGFPVVAEQLFGWPEVAFVELALETSPGDSGSLLVLPDADQVGSS